MKKVFIIAAAVGLFAVVSCKKDRTCTCTVKSSGTILGDFTVIADTVYTNMKKKDAVIECDKGDYTYTNGNENSSAECEIK